MRQAYFVRWLVPGEMEVVSVFESGECGMTGVSEIAGDHAYIADCDRPMHDTQTEDIQAGTEFEALGGRAYV